MEDNNEIENTENTNIPATILQGLEHLATILDIKKSLEIKEQKNLMEHEFRMKELEKNHEIELKKGEEYRKNIILFGVFGMSAMLLLLVFAWLMAHIGLKDTIFPTLQSLVSLVAVGFGAFHYAKKKNNTPNT